MLDLNSLNPQQRQAVEMVRGPVLILAGAGTGKTRVITFRIAHMVREGIAPRNILAVTFTNKAAREMKERVAKLLPARVRQRERAKEEGPRISTFHSLCARILREHIEVLGYKRNFVIYDESEQLGALRKVLSQISAKGESSDPRVLLALISRYKNGGARALADSPARAMVEHVLRRYESGLRACNAVDFDDLLLLVLRLFTEHPRVLAACRETFQYVMVDEYQDTNAAQFKLTHLLCEQHRNLCVVGDDDQSIYGWRGAEISNLLDRSTNVILQAANAVIQNNTRRRGKNLWSARGQGEKILLEEFKTDEEEARCVVDEIEAARLMRRIPWGGQAILFRTNQQSRPLEMALRQRNVRYHLIGGQSYFDRREVRDVLAYLKMFVNPHDDTSLLRIANVPARGLSDVTMERLLAASQQRGCSVYSAMRHTDVQGEFPERTRGSIRGWLEFIERVGGALSAEPSLMLAAWADRFLDEIGYFAELRRAEKNVETADNRIRNLKDLMSDLDRAAGLGPEERLQAFLEEISLDSEREEKREAQGDQVTLITMHSCKGLEFPHVYVVGLEDGLLPHSRSKMEGTQDEERRLFYVAITRAMETLRLSYCLGRKKYGAIAPCHPSPFLRELPAELVENAAERSKQPVAAGSGGHMFAAMRGAAE